MPHQTSATVDNPADVWFNRDMTNTEVMRNIAAEFGFTMTVGNGTDIFTRGSLTVIREDISYGIIVKGIRKPSVNSGLNNALLRATSYENFA